ncbi:hypothetical protein BH20ACT15_BH20ACT15_07880 [soil metagenome]
MNTYAIRREKAAASPDELKTAAGRSKEAAASDFPDDIAWIRSYVIAEGDGALGTICIYQASSPDAVRDHAKSAGLPADEILEVVDTMVVRPDPEPATS